MTKAEIDHLFYIDSSLAKVLPQGPRAVKRIQHLVNMVWLTSVDVYDAIINMCKYSATPNELAYACIMIIHWSGLDQRPIDSKIIQASHIHRTMTEKNENTYDFKWPDLPSPITFS